MALRYLDSFNTYAIGQIGRRYTISNPGALYTPTLPAAGLYSPNCLRLSTSALTAPQYLLTRTFDAQATWCVGFRFRYSALLASDTIILAQLTDPAGTQVELRLSPGALLSVTRNGTALTGGTAGSALLANTWYFIEWKTTISASISAGGCVVNVNGSQVLTVTAGQSTKAQTNATANAVAFGVNDPTSRGGSLAQAYDFGDLYICDGTAGETGLVGDRKVVIRAPAANGAHSDFTGSDGDSTNNYLLVNGAASTDDSSYVKSATISQTDTYGIAAHGADITTIYALQVVYTARKDAAGTRTVVPVLRDHVGTDHVMTGWSVGDTYTQYLFLSLTDPTTGSAWGTTNFDASEWGQQITA